MHRMGHYPRALAAAFSLAACAFLAGCLVDSHPSAPKYSGSDTSEINPDGSRRIQPPRVSYYTRDSIVSLDIAGTSDGYQNWYWIYRDGKLLDQPRPLGSESGIFHYFAYDTLHEAGTYAYTVRYGYRVSQLGPASPAFAYAYPGRSPSGTVSAESDEFQTVIVELSAPAHSGAVRARFERRAGQNGAIDSLGVLLLSNSGWAVYRDTGFAPYDTMLYYRAALMDGATEAWLAPTAWDSLRVYNRNWNYAPIIGLENLGTEARVEVLNRPASGILGGSFFFLYRSRSAERADGAKCDSLPGPALSLLLKDTPPDTGLWYYWAEARDSHGRTGPRSEPAAVRISGNPMGPGIRDITVYGDLIYVRGRPYENATAYILQRASDTSAAPVDVDTLSGPEAQRDPAFADIPPADGYWYYRLLAAAGDRVSSPGKWSVGGYFRRQDDYSVLSAPIRNLGAKGVQAALPAYPSGLSRLYRSSRPDGADSVAVDSILPADTSRILRDAPAKGTWYYRAYTYPKPSIQDYSIYRTAWTRVDFTGNAVGPAVLGLVAKGMGIDVNLAFDPDAIAFVVERSPDTSGAWVVIDTLSVFAGSSLTYPDRPPRNGNWSYRARTLSRDLALTDPGPFLTTASPWVYRVIYDDILSVQILNRGARVECPLTTTSSYGYYFKRGPAADYSDPVTVDSALIGDADAKMTDVPPRKVWYYWVERMIPAGVNSGSILRSVPVRVEFTGAPEAAALTRVSDGIQVAFPKPGPGDTLEIWRSEGQARDTADFTLIKTVTGPYASGTWSDAAPITDGPGFYNYRLILRDAEGATGFGPVKTFYYEPEASP
jgi:hypothetical protein